MARGTTPIDKIDWALLREQKQWLIDQDFGTTGGQPHAEGLVYLLGDLQDYAVEMLGLTELDVFGVSDEDEDDMEDNADDSNVPCEQCGSKENWLFENFLCTDCDPRTNPDHRKPFPKQ